jgi:hypothetical protein
MGSCGICSKTRRAPCLWTNLDAGAGGRGDSTGICTSRDAKHIHIFS